MSPWLVGLGLALAALAVGWWFGLRPELVDLPQEAPSQPTPTALTDSALRDSLQASLADMGLDPRRIRKTSLPGDARQWEWAVDLPAGWSLIRTNVAICEAVGRWGGRIGCAEEFRSLRTGGTSLRMQLGNDSTALGWLVLEGSAEAPRPVREEPRLAIVIDDFGYFHDEVVEAFIHFPYPITLGILPGIPYSEEIYRKACEAGKHTILHQPMEPHGYPGEDPGPNAILIEMDEEEIVEVFDRNLAGLPGVAGFSNHMGSAATEDLLVMRAVLGQAARRGLFFLDSLTSPRSVGARVAAEFGVPCVANELFIDNHPEDLESIKTMIGRLAQRARARGSVVGIGHPHRTTLDALSELLPEIESQGVRIVPVADLAAVRIARR